MCMRMCMRMCMCTYVYVHVHACDSRNVWIIPRSAMLDMSVVLGRGSPVMGEVSGSPAATREVNLRSKTRCEDEVWG